MVKTVIKFCTQNMAIAVILIGIIAIIKPEYFVVFSDKIAYLLGIVMLGMGMSLSIQDFKLVFKQPKNIFIGTMLQFIIMPLIALLLINLFELPPQIAIGVILVGACPGGTASNVITYLARGDVALSVSMTMCNTFLAPIVTPFLIWLLAGAWIEIDFIKMMLDIVKMVIVPLFIGIMLNQFFSKQVQKCNQIMPMISVSVIVILVGTVVSLSADTLLSSGLIIFAVVILHNLAGMSLGYIFAHKLKLGIKKERAMAIEVGMQNSGLAASLAILYFTAVGGIPAAIFSVWHNISGSLFASYMVNKDDKQIQQSVPIVHIEK